MGLSEGLKYNLRGLWFGIKKPKLLFLGIIRFVVVIIITMLAASLILVYHKELLDLIWDQPESYWILWLWYLLSWLVTFFFVGARGTVFFPSSLQSLLWH